MWKAINRVTGNMGLQESFLVCVEPETTRMFAINLMSGKASMISLNNNHQSEVTKTKVKREEYKVNFLLTRDIKEAQWDFNNEAVWNYRC